jgi:hypothetical protein
LEPDYWHVVSYFGKIVKKSFEFRKMIGTLKDYKYSLLRKGLHVRTSVGVFTEDISECGIFGNVPFWCSEVTLYICAAAIPYAIQRGNCPENLKKSFILRKTH